MTERTDRPSRYPILDAARGTAIMLMIVYHFSWDLTFFRLADFQIFTDPKWIWFAKCIVSIILVVMGMAQVMARQRAFDAKVFLRRFLLIAASAAAVSAATYWMDPRTYIFFGILHHIALASVIIAVVILLPSPVILLLVALLTAAPWWLVHPVFGTDYLLWVGLAPRAPISVDYVPLVPWLAIPLLGIVAGRWVVQAELAKAALAWQPLNAPSKILCLAGRHSLAIYLIHQPILYGALYLTVGMMG